MMTNLPRSRRALLGARTFFLGAVASLSVALTLGAQEPGAAPAPAAPAAPAAAAAADAPAAVRSLSAYPLATCVVSGRPLEEGKAKTFEVEGHTFKTCCGRCQSKVEADPATFAAQVDAAAEQALLALYPLETCPISGRALGDKARNVMSEGTLVRVCCSRCEAKAKAEPAPLVAAVRAAAVAAQGASYPTKTCVVSGHELEAEHQADVLVNGRLLRLCCSDCIDAVAEEPEKYLAAAVAAAAPAEAAGGADEQAKPAASGKAGGAGAAAAAEDGACCSGSAGEGSASCCSSGTKPAAGCCADKQAAPKQDDGAAAKPAGSAATPSKSN